MHAELGTFTLSGTPQRVRELFAGRLPTPEQMRNGCADEIDFCYVMAASVFVYLGDRFGHAASLDIARCSYTGRPTFNCASQYAATKGKSVSSTDIEQAWTGWAVSSTDDDGGRWVATYRHAGGRTGRPRTLAVGERPCNDPRHDCTHREHQLRRPRPRTGG